MIAAVAVAAAEIYTRASSSVDGFIYLFRSIGGWRSEQEREGRSINFFRNGSHSFSDSVKTFYSQTLVQYFPSESYTHTHTQTHTKEKKNILFAYFTTDELAPVDF